MIWSDAEVASYKRPRTDNINTDGKEARISSTSRVISVMQDRREREREGRRRESGIPVSSQGSRTAA